mmetsp:Transcript_3574/g.3324  ORF Transcript_3574/g.3324 Transcript_3574/m.3324 type:complete len:143 (-) Transcript_3574:46-474(-)|eukprot:CAMPEP_0196994980 /NCGR_PEP_ID=MMETSP1380-20130617/1186_1 /TAXON_ID=5936 /ORGANISM="Euplotes crassus, Strain CT5" /LENGTH=142 /DNA_ID=CAMNT_0042410507 /DNA_START=588 /DNA_END=1016 /DNA_ORIENTATION=+
MILSSNVNDIQNLGRKDLSQAKVLMKDPQHDSKREPSELSFNIVDHDDRSDLNLLGLTTQNGETVLRISARDLNHLEILHDESELLSPKNFRQNSKNKDPFDGHIMEDLDNDAIEALFKEEQAPALFRGTSGVIDPQTLKRK